MIKHNFHVAGGYTQFALENEFFALQDLYDRDINSVKATIEKLELVAAGKLDVVQLDGPHITTLLCKAPQCEVECIDRTYNRQIPLDWIIKLFKDWLAFLEQFEKSKGNS